MSKFDPIRLVSLFLLVLGLIAIALSVIYTSSVLAFIGLGLTFWGTLTISLATEKYVKQSVLNSAVTSSLADLERMLTQLEYQGRAVYLPPAYLKDFETTKAYLSKDKNADLPTPEEIHNQEQKIFLKNSEAALIIPPGLSLAQLFERTLGTTFTKVDVEYLQDNLPKLIIEDLEIAERLEMEMKTSEGNISDIVHVRITGSVLQEIWKEPISFSNTLEKIGCPLLSAIACALTKATGKPITIENAQSKEDGKIIEVKYHILGAIEPQGQATKVPNQVEAGILRSVVLSKAAGVFLLAFGMAFLAWIGWITWNDMTIWRKGLFLVLFGSRTGEAISLGIDLRVIHYFVVGLVLFTSGLIALTHARARR